MFARLAAVYFYLLTKHQLFENEIYDHLQRQVRRYPSICVLAV